MTHVTLVYGTWRGKWATDDGSGTLLGYLRDHGYIPHPFRGWTGNLDGTYNPFDSPPEAGDRHADWRAGGWAFRDRLNRIPYWDRNILTHSHGLHPVLYAATLPEDRDCPNQRIRTLVSICPPAREDMQARARFAVETGQIQCWHNVYTRGWDPMAVLGQLFDGRFSLRVRQRWPAAHVNISMPNIGHSRLLYDQALWPRLLEVLEVCLRKDRRDDSGTSGGPRFAGRDRAQRQRGDFL